MYEIAKFKYKVEISCVKLEKAKSLKFKWISAMPENFYSDHWPRFEFQVAQYTCEKI